MATCKYKYKGKEYTTQQFEELLNNDVRFKDLKPNISNSENITGKATSIKKSLRISDKIPLSEQNNIVKSLSFLLLNNPIKTDISNQDDVRNQIKLRYLNTSNLIENASEEYKKTNQYKNAVYGQKILSEVVANLDKFIDFANKDISDMNLSESFDGYYDDFEESTNTDEDIFASDNVHYNDNRSRTTDLKEFIPASVKKLMYYIPRYRILNLSNPNDLRLYNKFGSKYTTVNNVIGLPTFNNFGDTWSKTLQLLSQHNFDTNPQGIIQMIETMLSDEAPYVVQKLGERLRNSNPQTQHAFFVKTNLQLQNSITTYSKFDRDGNRQDNIFKSIDIVGTRKVTADLYSEFLSTPDIIKISTDNDGKEVRSVDKVYAGKLFDKVNKIIADPNSYISTLNKYNKYVKTIKDSTNSEAQDNAVAKLYDVFKRAGINISYDAFEDFILNNWTDKRKSTQLNIETLRDRILGRMMGKYSQEQLDPFESESSTINKLARYEFKYRPFKQADYFRIGNQSYYPFMKKSYLSDIFAKLRDDFNFVRKNEKKDLPSNSFAKRLLSTDIFARSSKFLKDIYSKAFKTIQDLEKFFTPKYELGFDSDSTNKEKKSFNQMTESEHLLAEYIYFQNAGRKDSYYFYDTLSDKSVQIPMQLPKLNLVYTGSIDEGDVQISDLGLNILFDSVQAEFNRINQVKNENILLTNNQKIEGYHDIGTKKGMGKYFLIYHFLNKEILQDDAADGNKLSRELLELLYPTGELVDELDDNISNKIKEKINEHFNKIFTSSKKHIFDNNLASVETTNGGSKVYDTKNLFNKEYKKKMIKDLGLNNEDPEFENKLIDNLVINYTVGYAQKTNELLFLTGDPAQAGKFISARDAAAIENKYSDNPVKSEAKILLASIKNSLVNLSKRNASLMASGELASWDKNDYYSSFAKDININSPRYEEYLKLFDADKKGLLDKSYNGGDGTDAWEVTTVEEYFTKNKAYGIINQDQFLLGLYTYDRDAYDKYIKNHPEYNKTTPKGNLDIFGLKFQPDKPVQRLSVIGPEVTDSRTGESSILNMSKQYYIKTSSFPLIPSLVKGTPWEDVLNGMKDNNVQRLAFTSGVKQGISGAKLLFNESTGEFNKAFFNDNVHKLDRSGFRIQMDVPYHEDKQAIREGSQMSKLLFVDQHDDEDMIYKGKSIKAGKLKKEYVDLHKKIYDLEKSKFYKELGVEEVNGIPQLKNLSKLSQILINEGLSKDFPINHLQSLDLDSDGNFATPLSFALNTGPLESMITAIMSNRMARVKLPGYSYIQGSGAYIKGGPKGRISTGEISEEVKDPRDIIWTKPEYAGTSRLSYITGENTENNSLSSAQILISPYISIGGKRINLRETDSDGNYIYLIETETGNLILNRDKIDPDLLEMNGFRIPFQGLNSGMWFEIVGFLPSYVGDLAIVPEEIGAQMGSDYDVDKLYSYMPAYYKDSDGSIKSVSDNTTIKQFDTNKQALRDQVFDIVRSQGSIDSEIAQNKLVNAIFSESDESLPIDKKTILRDRFNNALTELGLTSSDITSTSQEDLDILKHKNDIINIHKAVFTNKNNLTAMIDPLAFDDVNDAINEVDKLNPSLEEDFEGIYSPNYQREVYFSNVSGKIGVAISALANTFHAIGQNTSAFLKGQGILIAEDPSSEIYSDATEYKKKSNRTNEYKDGMYDYEEITYSGKIIKHSQLSKNSAWRLDKVKTFDGKYTISNLISQILGVSVDNAKEQLLGKFGINNHNFNVALSMIQTGFNLVQVKKFITQPIMQEYYKVLDQLENIYQSDYTPNRREESIKKLFSKYGNVDLYKSPVEVSYISDMDKGIVTGEVNSSNALSQLKMLNAFISYQDYARDIQKITSALNIDTKGLPKNISDTLIKEGDINAINELSIGNADNIENNSIIGVYSGLPKLTNNIFTRGKSPIFAYGTTLYTNIKNNILLGTGKLDYYKGELDIVHNNIKNFIYSGFFNEDNNISELREQWLFDSETNKSLSTRHKELLNKYPKNFMLQYLQTTVSKNAKDPSVLKVLLSDDKGFAQRMTESWEDNLNSDNEDIRLFSEDLAKYALSTGNKEFGQSNIIKYIPFEFLYDSGFNEYLKDTNKYLSYDTNSEIIAEQIIQHNPQFVKSVDIKAIVSKSAKYYTNEQGQGVLTSFSLPVFFRDASSQAKRLGTMNEDGTISYPKYIKIYSKTLKKNLLYKADGYKYELLPTLGTDTETEYNSSVIRATSMFERNSIPNVLPLNSFVESRIKIDNSSDLSVEKVVSDSKTNNELMDNTVNMLRVFSTNQNDSPAGKQFANISLYYKDLMEHLQKLNFSDVTISFDNSIKTNGQTSLDGKTITINPELIKKDKKLPLPYELNFARVLLHEMIHSASNKNIIQGKELTEVESAYNEYKKAIWAGKLSMKDNTKKLRNIPLNAFNAELTKALIQRFGSKSNGKDLNISNIQDIFSRQDGRIDETLTDLLKDVEKSLNELKSQGLISGNFDLTSSPQRFDSFKKYLAETYIPNIGNMLNTFYAYSSVKEFMTEATTNPFTIKQLSSVPSLHNRVKNAILNFIKKALGIKNRSLLDDAVESVLGYISNDEVKQHPVDNETGIININNESDFTKTSKKNDIKTSTPSVKNIGQYVKFNDETYIVTKVNSNGTIQIYNPNKEGTFAKKSVAERNLTPLNTKANIVTYKGSEYIVTPKNTIISLKANKKMNWGDENGDRINILNLANEKKDNDLNVNLSPKVIEKELFNENPELANIGTPEQYSQYLDSLNKPNTNPILQNNQEEQVKKFAELQERLNNKEFIEGAKNAYESTPALQQFGTQEEYNDYVARVSLGIIKNPSNGKYNYTSQVKDIGYHFSMNKFEVFNKQFIGKNTNKNLREVGYYFSNNRELAKLLYGTQNIQDTDLETGEPINLKKEGFGIAAILNNPKIIKERDDISGYGDYVESNSFLVKEPEQIHILSSKADIQGFKDFVQGKQFQKLTAEEDDNPNNVKDVSESDMNECI